MLKKKKTTLNLMIKKGRIQKRLKELEEDYSKEVFNRVAFITFNKQSEA